MDELIKQGHWWWLLVVPVLTGAFALFGSWWGSKLGRTTEHWQWLRNEKRMAYITAVSAMDDMTHSLHGLAGGTPTQRIEVTAESFIAPINVLAPENIRRGLKAFMDASSTCIAILHEPPSEEQLRKAKASALIANQKYAKLLEDFRADLEVRQ